MATMVTLLMGNYQLDMTLATACDTDVADNCKMEKNMRQEGDMLCLCVYLWAIFLHIWLYMWKGIFITYKIWPILNFKATCT